jgi:integrase
LNVGLLDAIRSFIETHRARSAFIPFGQLFDRFLETKAKRSEKYKVPLRWAKERFGALHDRLTSDITVRDLDGLLNWGVKRDYLTENPINKLDFEEVVKGDTEIFEPKIVQALLQDCLEDDLAFLPYRVLGFFCGIWPDGELHRLQWSDIDSTDKVVRLRAEITKKRRLRFVDLSENALACLEAYKSRGGKLEGSVVPFTSAELRDRQLRAELYFCYVQFFGVRSSPLKLGSRGWHQKGWKPKRRWISKVHGIRIAVIG